MRTAPNELGLAAVNHGPTSGYLTRKAMMNTDQNNKPHEIEHNLGEQEQEAKRLAIRENAKRVLRDSGLAEMLQGINKNLLKGRGRFEEYDSMVLFKWGTGYTLRHIWVEVEGNTIRFRLHPHRKCAN